MNTLTKIAFGTFFTSTSLMTIHVPAQAVLLGDTVRAELILFGVGTLLDETDTVVDPGVEFISLGRLGSSLNLDVKNDSFDIIYDLGGAIEVGLPTTWILSDLDWVDTPGIITDVTLRSGDASLISGISFTDDSITIDVRNPFFPPPQVAFEAWTFDIETQKTSVPESSTLLGLLAVGSIGALVCRKKG